MRVAVITIAFGVASSIIAACRSSGPPCYEGDYQACSCAENRAGYQRCLADETYGACLCDGTTPGLDGSVDATPSLEASTGKTAFMGKCVEDEDCESGICHLFAAKGQFCSHPCKAAADCEPPSGGCNNQGVCKAP